MWRAASRHRHGLRTQVIDGVPVISSVMPAGRWRVCARHDVERPVLATLRIGHYCVSERQNTLPQPMTGRVRSSCFRLPPLRPGNRPIDLGAAFIRPTMAPSHRFSVWRFIGLLSDHSSDFGTLDREFIVCSLRRIASEGKEIARKPPILDRVRVATY